MSEKAANVQREKEWRDLHKAWRTNDQDLFERLKREVKSGCLEAKYEETRGGSQYCIKDKEQTSEANTFIPERYEKTPEY